MAKKENKKFYIKTYAKGLLMGTCDLIPGISGGTIAFITGIYERLINAISAYTPKTKIQYLKALIKKDKKTEKTIITRLDILFLLTLISGIATAILLGSHLVSFLLHNYEIYILTFFIGLIVASTKMIYDKIEKQHSIGNSIFAIIGLIIGTLMIFLSPQNLTSPSNIYIIMGGFLAIVALFLPGISGAFILLILGLYEYIIDALSNIFTEYKPLIFFAIGALAGVLIVSRIIKFFLTKYRAKTLYLLLGFVVGSLCIPISKVIKVATFTLNQSAVLLLLFVLGTGIILLINKYLN